MTKLHNICQHPIKHPIKTCQHPIRHPMFWQLGDLEILRCWGLQQQSCWPASFGGTLESPGFVGFGGKKFKAKQNLAKKSLTTWSLYRLYHIIPNYTSVWRWNSCAAGFRGLILLFFMFFCLTYHRITHVLGFGAGHPARPPTWISTSRRKRQGICCSALQRTSCDWKTMEDLWCTMMIHDVPIRSYRICNVLLGDAEIENQQTPKTSHHCQNFCWIHFKATVLALAVHD